MPGTTWKISDTLPSMFHLTNEGKRVCFTTAHSIATHRATKGGKYQEEGEEEEDEEEEINSINQCIDFALTSSSVYKKIPHALNPFHLTPDFIISVPIPLPEPSRSSQSQPPTVSQILVSIPTPYPSRNV